MPEGWKTISIPEDIYEYIHEEWENDKKILRRRYGIRSFSGYVHFLLRELLEINHVLQKFDLTREDRRQMLVQMITTWTTWLWNEADEKQKKVLEEKGIIEIDKKGHPIIRLKYSTIQDYFRSYGEEELWRKAKEKSKK